MGLIKLRFVAIKSIIFSTFVGSKQEHLKTL